MRITALCAVTLLGSTQVAWSANDPKPVDRAAIHAALKSVGVLPMRVPSLIPNGEDVARRFEAGIEERLRAAGFQVVGAQAMRDIHARLGAELGGIYDPMTGATTRQKVDEREQLARARYLEAQPVDWIRTAGRRAAHRQLVFDDRRVGRREGKRHRPEQHEKLPEHVGRSARRRCRSRHCR